MLQSGLFSCLDVTMWLAAFVTLNHQASLIASKLPDSQSGNKIQNGSHILKIIVNYDTYILVDIFRKGLS